METKTREERLIDTINESSDVCLLARYKSMNNSFLLGKLSIKSLIYFEIVKFYMSKRGLLKQEVIQNGLYNKT